MNFWYIHNDGHLKIGQRFTLTFSRAAECHERHIDDPVLITSLPTKYGAPPTTTISWGVLGSKFTMKFKGMSGTRGNVCTITRRYVKRWEGACGTREQSKDHIRVW